MDILFTLNVTGTTQLPTLVLVGTITSESAGTASKPVKVVFSHNTLSIGYSDYQGIVSRSVMVTSSVSTVIRLFASNDEITLEYEDKVRLRFTPGEALLIPGLASNYEYLRDTLIINITDNDRKYTSLL